MSLAEKYFDLLLWVVWLCTIVVLGADHEAWLDGSLDCHTCACSLTRPQTFDGSPVKYANCTGIYLEQLPLNLPKDTEYLDVSRQPIYSGTSLRYGNVPDEVATCLMNLRKLKCIDFTGNSFEEFNSDHLSHLEFLSHLTGLEVQMLTSESFRGLQQVTHLDLRTPMNTLADNIFQHLKLTELTLRVDNAQTIPDSLFNPLNTSLKSIGIHGDQLSWLPESLLDNLELLQNFKLVAPSLDELPEHILHGSTLFRNLNLKEDIPDEMWMVLHSMSNTRYLKEITLDGIKHLPENLFQYIPYLETISLCRTETLDPNLFKRLVRLNSLGLAENNISDVKTEWFKDLGGLKSLNLSGNQLTLLMEGNMKNLHSLEVLDLSRNELASVDARLFETFRTGLEDLRLNANNLTSFDPDVFKEMWSLEKLYLDNNSLVTIDETMFADLHKLETLTLDHNEIENIDEDSFSSLQDLRNLDLSYNNITAIPDNLFSQAISLQSVNLSQNHLEKVPSSMLGSHFWLRNLDAGTNPLHCDCAVARLVEAHKQSQISGKCTSPAEYQGIDIINLPTSAMCTAEEQAESEMDSDNLDNKNSPLDSLTDSDSGSGGGSSSSSGSGNISNLEEGDTPTTQTESSSHQSLQNPGGRVEDLQTKNRINHLPIDSKNTDITSQIREKYPQDDNSNDKDNNIDKDVNNETMSNSLEASSEVSKKKWVRTPWVVASLIILLSLLLVGCILAVIKARGHLYRNDYSFDYSREYIIEHEEDSTM